MDNSKRTNSKSSDSIYYKKSEIAFCGRIKESDTFFSLVVLSANSDETSEQQQQQQQNNEDTTNSSISSSCLVFKYVSSNNLANTVNLPPLEIVLNEIARLYRNQDCVFNHTTVDSSIVAGSTGVLLPTATPPDVVNSSHHAVAAGTSGQFTYANLNYELPPGSPLAQPPPPPLPVIIDNNNKTTAFVVLNKQTNDIYFNKENVSADDRLVYVSQYQSNHYNNHHFSASFRDDLIAKDVSSLSTLDDNQSLDDTSLNNNNNNNKVVIIKISLFLNKLLKIT